MRKTILIVIACLVYGASFSQTIYKDISSERLNTVRQLKIKLPKDYNPNSEIKHPVIVVFDADYLFEPIAGQVDFQTYFDDMPSSIIVGVMQGSDRRFDAYFDPVTGMPEQFGLRFYEFISTELLPYIDNKYNTSQFRVAVGHNLMGHFINSYIFQPETQFQAYVCLSPEFTGSMQNVLAQQLEASDKAIFYYMATSEKDIPAIRDNVLEVNDLLKKVSNPNVTYYFDNFEDETHYTLVNGAIAKSFDKIFELYNPLREKELKEKVLTYDGTLDTYLIDRYDRIEKLFGITKKISEGELEIVAEVAEQREDYKSLNKLGKLANKLFPESLLGTYYIAHSLEKTGKTKKAKKVYESALALKDATNINKDYIAEKIKELTVVSADINEDTLEDAEDYEEK